ncbi:unnamed protein product [Amoebophrya sp. A25]|nr:unnamed protein product [Amoebophrya sp. A25]|eukprot:GSA25T00009267001.1
MRNIQITVVECMIPRLIESPSYRAGMSILSKKKAKGERDIPSSTLSMSGSIHQPWKVSDFHSYRFCDVWGGTNEEATEKVHAFFETDYFREGLEPVAGAREVLYKYAEKYKEAVEFHIVTSRQHVILQETHNWVNRHFGKDLFASILAGNHWTRENTGVVVTSTSSDSVPTNTGKARSKAEMCREIGANVLIDDSPSYISDCLENAGPQFRKAVVFGDYGWNTKFDIGPFEKEGKAVRCSDWQAVDRVLESMLGREEKAD